VKINGPVEVDFPAIMERLRKLRASIAHNDSAHRFQNDLGVDVFIGHGKFTGEKQKKKNTKRSKKKK
jgi:pyruvate/2-oxoglutarate dehydrogenase complex dihydrolipoamide dehydrogenase (E3) component